jgi:adenylate kinase family enzyme
VCTGEREMRKSVCKKLGKRYGFVYVSVLELIKEQISRNTEVGRLALMKMRDGKLI